MMRSLFSAVSGLKNHQTAMDVIGNDISNVNTIAYKGNRVIFSDIYSQTISAATAPSANTGGTNAEQIGLGMNISGIKTNITAGSQESTGNTMDFYVNGEGYFVVKASDGNEYYTRNGSLDVDSSGNLIAGEGNYVMGVMVPDDKIGNLALKDYGTDGTTPSDPNDVLSKIKINQDRFKDYSIDGNGVITAVVKATTDPGGTTPWTSTLKVGDQVEIGRIVMGTFINAAGLEKAGGSLYSASANSGKVNYSFTNEGMAGALKSGCLEMSNVDLATEMTNMIIMQRGFQANSRVITTSDTMLEELVNLKRS